MQREIAFIELNYKITFCGNECIRDASAISDLVGSILFHCYFPTIKILHEHIPSNALESRVNASFTSIFNEVDLILMPLKRSCGNTQRHQLKWIENVMNESVCIENDVILCVIPS